MFIPASMFTWATNHDRINLVACYRSAPHSIVIIHLKNKTGGPKMAGWGAWFGEPAGIKHQLREFVVACSPFCFMLLAFPGCLTTSVNGKGGSQ